MTQYVQHINYKKQGIWVIVGIFTVPEFMVVLGILEIVFVRLLKVRISLNVVQAEETRLVLTKPIALDEESDGYTAPNPLQLVLNLLKNVRPGSDLTNFQVSKLYSLSLSLSLYIYTSRKLVRFTKNKLKLNLKNYWPNYDLYCLLYFI